MNAGHAQGELLAQVQPGVTTPVTLFEAMQLRIEITLILAAVVPGSAGNLDIDIFHDVGGTTYDDTNFTNLILSVQKADNADGELFQAQHPGSGIHLAPGDSLGGRISVANDVTLSIYGISETLAERNRGSR